MNNKLMPMGKDNPMANFIKTDDIIKDMCWIIESSCDAAYKAVNDVLVQRNWLIGYRIAEEGFHGLDRAEYGSGIIAKLAKNLRLNMEKDLRKLIYITFIYFIKSIHRFSTHRVDELYNAILLF